uniref:Calbindin n=1 Tax=Laticauda laticaudata TaxID=8630 RepID=A0A8C5WWW2_LATLA
MTAEAYLQLATVSASQFFAIWRHYDADGNGYMDGNELQGFIQELQQARQKAGLGLTPEMKTFVDHFSKSSDGKIGIVELAQILPTEENFLLFFRCQQLKSSEDFMQTWRKYDSDHSGYIDAEELKNFLKDLLQKANKQIDDLKLSEYTDIMVRPITAISLLELIKSSRLIDDASSVYKNNLQSSLCICVAWISFTELSAMAIPVKKIWELKTSYQENLLSKYFGDNHLKLKGVLGMSCTSYT